MNTTDPWLGHVIDGRYRLEQRIADGGFGTVYRAQHLGFARPVAVKLLRIEKQVADFLGDGRRRFITDLRAEGTTQQQLASVTTGVVHALDVGETTSPAGLWAPYLVLDWVDGEQLGAYAAQRGPMPLEEALDLLEPVAEALQAAHELGIVHRDVKPGNILVVRVGSGLATKLLDFGIAKVMCSDVLTRARSFTKLSFLGFTPAWGAPEQFDPSIGHTGSWTDVYALALVVAGLVAGTRPYGSGAVEGAVRALDRERRPSPRYLGATVSDSVEAAFLRALAIDPRNRPTSVHGLWQSLRGQADVRPASVLGDTTVRDASMRDATVRAPATVPTAPPSPATPRYSPQSQATVPTATSATSPAIVSNTVLAPQPHPSGLTQRTTESGFAPDPALRLAPFPPAPPPPRALDPIAPLFPSPPFRSSSGPHSGKSFASWLVALLLVATGGGAIYLFFAHVLSRPTPSAADSPTVSKEPTATSKGKSVLIPGGTVTMGRCTEFSSKNYFDLCPAEAHSVAAFRMDRLEVTVREYRACVAQGACTPPGTSDKCTGNSVMYDRDDRLEYPMNCVTQPQAAQFCSWAGGRLPTSAEWEMAARGPEGRSYPWGEDSPASRANFLTGEVGSPTPVGSFGSGATPLGILDMAGNVWEWTAGDPPIPPAKLKSSDPKSPLQCDTTPCAAAYGGSFAFDERRVYAFRRLLWPRAMIGVDVGFRCAHNR